MRLKHVFFAALTALAFAAAPAFAGGFSVNNAAAQANAISTSSVAVVAGPSWHHGSFGAATASNFSQGSAEADACGCGGTGVYTETSSISSGMGWTRGNAATLAGAGGGADASGAVQTLNLGGHHGYHGE